MSTVPRPTPLLAAAQALAVDAATAEVSTALARAGVASVLLKGPTLAEWLYRDGSVRSYTDVDLLVAPDRIPAAEAVLARLGFEPLEEDSDHAEPWARPADLARVDLHRRLWRSAAPPARAWSILCERAVATMPVAAVDVTVPTLPARALLVACHAAQHADVGGKPLEDLRRALDAAPPEVWREAAALAEALGLLHALADGLSLTPAARAVADGLPLVALLQRSPDLAAARLERIATTDGLPRRARLVLGVIVPPPDVLRWSSGIARRGRRGLAVAYVVRAVRIVVEVVPALLRWRRLRG